MTVIETHRPEPMQQAARVVEHHPRLCAFTNELRDELADGTRC